MTEENYHMFFRAFDGSEAVRHKPGDPWVKVKGDDNSTAAEHVQVQNQFLRTWFSETISENRVKFVRRD